MRDSPPARCRPRRPLLLLLLSSTVLAGAGASLPARAQTLWTGATDSDWFTAGNWNPAAVPTGATSVQINTTAPNATIVGAAGAQANQLTLGQAAGQTGSLTVDGAGSTLALTNAGGLFLVGNFGDGDVTVSDGATLTTFTAAIGNQAGSVGAVTITGTGSQWNLTALFAFHVGSSGSGTLDVLAGGQVTSAAFGMDLGVDNGATGDVFVSGAGSALTVGSITNIGSAAGGTGIMQASSGGLLALQTVNVGNLGQGTLTVDSGADLTASQLTVGSSAQGDATFTGAGTTAVITNAVRVGLNNGGDGTLSIENGATLTSRSSLIGQQTGATGSATVTGTGSRWTIDEAGFIASALTIGQAGANTGSGTLSILNGGELIMGSANSSGRFQGFNSATVTVDGANSRFALNPGTTALFSLGSSGASNRLDVTDGGTLTAGAMDFSTVAGSGVAVNVAGDNSSLQATGRLNVPGITLGGPGTATMTVDDNASVGVVGDFIVDGSAATSLTISNGAAVTHEKGSGDGQFRLGVDAHGTLLIESGGTFESLPDPIFTNFTFFARNAGSSATATVTGAGSTFTTAGIFTIGSQGSATLEILDGGTVNSAESTNIGFFLGGSGGALVSGVGSTWNSDGGISVGVGGTGSIRIEDGALVAASGVNVGSAFDTNTPGTGTLVVTGAASRLNLNVSAFQSLAAGSDGGTGTIDVLDGAVSTVVGQGHFGRSSVFIGDTPQQALGHGTLTVNGAGSRVTFTQTLDIGEQATGVLNIQNGGFVSNSDGYLGSFTNALGSAGHGTATVTGAGSTWQNSGTLRVGDFGTGILNVMGGGLVTNTNAIVASANNSSGTATVTGANSTWTSTGNLTVGNNGAATLQVLGGGLVTNNNAVIASGANSNSTATVSGAGSIWTSTGNLTIGNNGTAALTVAAGGTVNATNVSINALSSLNFGAGALAGTLNATTIANTGTINFNHTGSLTFAAPLTGTGNVVKAGSGTTIITGMKAYSGTTTVNGGTMLVNGSIANSAVTVNAGGTLGGDGTVGSTTIAGTVAPGNSIGTLTVSGNATFGATSVYQVEIAASLGPLGPGDFMDVSGTATINAGARVSVVKQIGSYTAGTRYHILHADGGVTGTFVSPPTQNLPFLALQFFYDPNNLDIYLEVLLNQAVAFTDVAHTPNQRAAASGAESLGVGDPVFDAISNLNEDEARYAFDQISGEIHASLKGALIESWRYLRSAITSRLRSAQDAGSGTSQLLAYAPGMNVHAPEGTDGALWMQAQGAWGKTDGDGNAASLDRRLGGVLVGVDRTIGDWRAGLAGGFNAASLKIPARASAASTDTFQLAAYAGKQHGPIGVRLGASAAHHEIDTTRRVSFPGFSETLSANYRAYSLQAFGEAGYQLQYRELALEPFAALALVHLRTGSFTERGGAAALSAGSSTDMIAYSTIGIRAAREISIAGMPFVLRGALAWRHAFGDVTPDRSLAFAASSPFTVAGVPIARNSALIEAGLSRQIADRTTIDFAYSGEIAAAARDHSFKGRLTSRF